MARRLRLPRRLGLRARITLAFSVGALGLSALLSATTWALTRQNLVNQLEESAQVLVYQNARTVRSRLATETGTNAQQLVTSLSTQRGARPVIYHENEPWAPISPEFGEDALPRSLRRTVIEQGQPARMRYELRSDMQLAIGIPLPAVDAAYFEIVALDDLESTLEALGVSLVGASLVTTLAGGSLGWWASRRTLRPLAGVSAAATALAAGRLDTRLEGSDDPDLAPIAQSFNEMAGALQQRIESDARFASDVSHELRSPLMTLAASVEVLENQRDDLPDRSKAALDLIALDVRRFQQLVEDLLEVSRFDAGVARLELEEVNFAELVMQAVNHSSETDVPVEVDAELAGVVVNADKRRIVRVIANLLDNAAKYGGGASTVSLRRVDERVQIAVEDSGPGVAPEDREVIFDRFSRGSGAGRRGTSEGVGLGLSLVREHVHLHGGRIWVEDRADGAPGARFVVELPVEEPA